MPFACKYSWVRWLNSIRLSLFPQDIQSNFNFFLASSGLGISTSGAFVLGAAEKAPIQANLSRWPNPKFNACPPPIESPAIALYSLSFKTGYFFSIKGIKSLSRSFSKVSKALTFSGAIILPTARSSFIALPLGITTIMGSILPSA